MTTTDQLYGAAIPLTKGSKGLQYIPLFLSTAMIVGMGIATAATASPQTLGQQTPPPAQQQNPPGQAKPTDPVKPIEIKVTADMVPGITFADKSGVTYVKIRTLSERLGLEIELDPNEKFVKVGDKTFDQFRRLYAGDIIVPIRDISKFEGSSITPGLDPNTVTVLANGVQFDVVVGTKRIEVDKAAQELTAFQGDIVVIKTNVSTGRPGHNTPIGDFKTGPKERMHYSHKYNDAEMPYAVQVNGDIFFHGFGSVPSYPASHGCIRIPLGRKNPAKYLFSWVHRGIDVKIFGTYTWESHHTKRRKKHR